MINFEYFDMIINRRFINSEEFYKLIIKQWFDKTDKNFEGIIIYTDNIERVKASILNILPSISCFIRVGKIHNIDKKNIEFGLEMKNNKLFVNIQHIDRIDLDQRGVRAAGVIIDMNIENKCKFNEYLDEDTISMKLSPMLVAPTNLNIGFILYY